jgi:hypothetical protein
MRHERSCTRHACCPADGSAIRRASARGRYGIWRAMRHGWRVKPCHCIEVVLASPPQRATLNLSIASAGSDQNMCCCCGDGGRRRLNAASIKRALIALVQPLFQVLNRAIESIRCCRTRIDPSVGDPRRGHKSERRRILRHPTQPIRKCGAPLVNSDHRHGSEWPISTNHLIFCRKAP